MSFLFKIMAFSAYLAGSVFGAPASRGSTATPPRWQECEAGTWYHKCGKNDGCFNYDPCTLASSETPSETPSEKPCPTDLEQAGRRVLPSTYWTIDPNAPDQGYDAADYFYLLNNTKTDKIHQQVLVFQGIDASRAKTCKINWYMNLQEETVFKVEGDGCVRFTQLPGFPVERASPTFNSLLQFESEDAPTTMPAMGGWDNKSIYLGHKQDSATEVPCAEAMAFLAKLDGINQNGGMVYMEPSNSIGVSIDYWC